MNNKLPTIEEIEAFKFERLKTEAIYLRKKVDSAFQSMNELVRRLSEKDRQIEQLSIQLNQMMAMKSKNEQIYMQTLQRVNDVNNQYLEEIRQLKEDIKKLRDGDISKLGNKGDNSAKR